jgi:Ser/Thr protein kinase RdoA (MazF antagonist)
VSVQQRAVAVLSDGWQIQGAVQPLGQGLINDTFLVRIGGSPPTWVLQRINADVFSDPGLVMQNVARVVRHLQVRAPGLVADLVPTPTGENCYTDADTWRLWGYVADAATLQVLRNERQAFSSGCTFARLQNSLVDLPGPRLQEPIPGFMRMPHYLDQLEAASKALSKPDAECANALAFVDARRGLAHEFQVASTYVHGDCKVNNLLFRGDRACCVLDLDTVMHGHWAWDFGDLARSSADVDGIFSIELYGAMARGFIGESRERIDEQSLVLAPRYVGLMLGIRFLTDHLAGDTYFRVRNRGDNMVRAAAQFELVRQMEAAEENMRILVRQWV